MLTADEWTPESGLVNAAQKKLQRNLKKIAQKYDFEILVRFCSSHIVSALYCVVI